MTVKQILRLMNDCDDVGITFYAYGQYYASSTLDGMETVSDCKHYLNYDCLKAKVIGIESKTYECVKDDGIKISMTKSYVSIKAEIVH